MRLARRLGVALMAAIGALMLGVVPAMASETQSTSPQVDMQALSAHPDTLTISFTLSAGGLPEGDELDPKTVRVSLDGLAVPSTVSSAAETPIEQVAVLTIDTSGSMLRDEKIEQARSAAAAFVEAAPPETKIGLVTFDNTVQTLLAPTDNRTEITAAIDQIEAVPNGDTALWSGIEHAVQVASTSSGTRSVLVLTDGENDSDSPSTVQTAVDAITRAGVRVDVVALGDYAAFAGDLNAVAEAGKGQVVGAESADDLAAPFTAAAEALDRVLSVSAEVPPQFYGDNVEVSASVQSPVGRLADQAALSLAELSGPAEEVAGPRPVSAPSALGTPFLWVSLGGIFAAVAAILAIAAVTVTRQHTRSARVAALIGGEPIADAPPPPQLHLRDRATDLAGRVLSSRGLDKTLADRLEWAGLPLRPAEWVLLHVFAAVGLGILFLALTGNAFAALVGVVIGVLGPLAFLERRGQSRHDEFTSALPETLQMISGGLSAGLTLRQSVEAVAEDGRPPVREEVRRALAQARLGMPLEDALDEVAERMHSKDFSWIVMVMRIQREVGGNLPELLGLVSATLRERDRLRRQVRVLSAEGRISAWVVGLLPIAFITYMLITRPDYLEPLVNDPLGWAMLLGGGTLFVGGIFWLSRLTNLKV